MSGGVIKCVLVAALTFSAASASGQTYEPSAQEAEEAYELAANTYGDALYEGRDEVLPLADEFGVLLDAAQGTEHEAEVEYLSANLRDAIRIMEEEALLMVPVSNAAESLFGQFHASRFAQPETTALWSFCYYAFRPMADSFSLSVSALGGLFAAAIDFCESLGLTGDEYEE